MSGVLHLRGAASWRKMGSLRQRGLKSTSTSRLSSPAFPPLHSHTHLSHTTTESLAAQVKYKSMNNGIIITYNSDHRLHTEDFLKAFTHLNNKVELLRTCFRTRDNQLWYCRMPESVIDFKVVNGPDEQNEMQRMIDTPFNLADGPLWKARLLPGGGDDHSTWPELQEEFPHQNRLLLEFHHAAVDGVDMFTITDWLAKLLEDIISGKPIDDNKQLGQLVDHSQVVAIEQQVKQDLEKDPERLKLLLEERKKQSVTPLILEAFGVQDVPHPQTEYLGKTLLDMTMFEKFNKRCRSAGVTFNSGFVALMNTALIGLVKEAGVHREEYTLTNRHAVDLRRYLKGHKAFPMGNHSFPMMHSMTVPGNVRDTFWDYAKQFDVDFRTKLENNYIFEDFVLSQMLRPDGYSHEKNFANPPPQFYNYSLTNVFSPKFSNMGIGKHIQITSMQNIVPIGKSEVAIMSGLANLRNKVRFSAWYSTHTMTRDTAQKFFDRVLSLFRELSD
ncbi:putative Condensation domain-containing protein [Homarus americanus]|uniref:Putative Condensation domain-containing protein n=1 Tax=Homarus americanus TaxID=6706 RepID=A0A8J5N6K1_HOMAM|nr:putative Condensation domain-containing protein [Homarus americanus]